MLSVEEKNIRKVFNALSKSKTKCDMDYPNFRSIKVQIIQINLENIVWQVKVKILEKGLTKKGYKYVDNDTCGLFGGDIDDDNQIQVEIDVPVTEEWVGAGWLTNFEK